MRFQVRVIAAAATPWKVSIQEDVRGLSVAREEDNEEGLREMERDGLKSSSRPPFR